jgi:hypothetical protein
MNRGLSDLLRLRLRVLIAVYPGKQEPPREMSANQNHIRKHEAAWLKRHSLRKTLAHERPPPLLKRSARHLPQLRLQLQYTLQPPYRYLLKHRPVDLAKVRRRLLLSLRLALLPPRPQGLARDPRLMIDHRSGESREVGEVLIFDGDTSVEEGGVFFEEEDEDGGDGGEVILVCDGHHADDVVGFPDLFIRPEPVNRLGDGAPIDEPENYPQMARVVREHDDGKDSSRFLTLKVLSIRVLLGLRECEHVFEHGRCSGEDRSTDGEKPVVLKAPTWATQDDVRFGVIEVLVKFILVLDLGFLGGWW